MKRFQSVILAICILSFVSSTVCLAIDYKGKRPEPAVKDFWVSAMRGSDTIGEGTEPNPWRTITHAIASIGDTMAYNMTIHIAEGKYDMTIGEKFPLEMRDFISLIGINPDSTVIDAANSKASVIKCKVNYMSIENLTITGGTGILDGMYDYSGGGLFIQDSNPTIRNCLIRANNTSFKGGGVYCSNSAPRFIGCTIVENYAGRFGGGICCEDKSIPQIENCFIRNNSSSLSGGGISCNDSSPHIINSEIVENHVVPIEAGLYYEVYGAGIYLTNNSTPLIEFCKINFNQSLNYGGGIYCNLSAPKIINCEISGNVSATGGGGGIFCHNSSPAIFNCIVSMNQSQSVSGGGIYCDDTSQPVLTNLTIVDNHAPEEGGAIFAGEMTNLTLVDSIVWFCGQNPIVRGKSFNMTYCDVEGYRPITGDTNFGLDPQFVAGPWSQYYLSSTETGQYVTSSCIDAGSGDASSLKMDISTTRLDGKFDKGIVDIGYHNPPHIQFALHTMPDQEYYTDADTIRLILDLAKVPPSHVVDLYLVIMDNTTGQMFSAPAWTAGLTPYIENLPLPIEIFFKNAALLELSMKNGNPPFWLQFQHTYTFAIAAFESKTKDLISNISTTSFGMTVRPLEESVNSK
jgi:hypothetical protein